MMAKNDLITEEQLLDWLKIELRTLTELRLKKGLPFHPITSRVRFYSHSEVSKWIIEQRPGEILELASGTDSEL